MYIPVTADDAYASRPATEEHEAQLEAAETAIDEAIATLTIECPDADAALARLSWLTTEFAKRVIWMVERDSIDRHQLMFLYNNQREVHERACEVETTCGASDQTHAIHDAIATVKEVLGDLLPPQFVRYMIPANSHIFYCE